jgi:hypothetical protein
MADLILVNCCNGLARHQMLAVVPCDINLRSSWGYLDVGVVAGKAIKFEFKDINNDIWLLGWCDSKYWYALKPEQRRRS